MKKAIIGLAVATIFGALAGPAYARANAQLAALPVIKPDRLVLLKSEQPESLVKADSEAYQAQFALD